MPNTPRIHPVANLIAAAIAVIVVGATLKLLVAAVR